MSLIIIGKVAAGSLGALVVGMSGLFVVNPVLFKKWFLTPHDVEIYGIGLAESNDPATFSNSQALQCQIDGAEKFDCKLQEVTKLTDDSDNTKKQVPLSVFNDKQTKTDLTTLLAEKKMYKITTLSSSFYDKDWKAQTIKVWEQKDIVSKSWGSISSLFKVQTGKETAIGSTHMFVGQASGTATLTTSDSHKCSWKPTPSTEGLQDCKIFTFVDNDGNTNQKQDAKISDLSFKKTDTVARSTKMSHYYLIKFTAPSDSKDLESFDVEGEEIIYLKDGSDDTVTFKKLSAVTVVEDQLLILKQHLKQHLK